MINSILEFLNEDYNNEGFFIKEFSNDIYFGKDKNGNCVCVRNNNSNEQSFSLKTKSIELYQNYHFTFQTDEGIIEDKYDMIILTNKYADTRKTFINLCLNFYSSDDDRSIIELTEDLIELYKTTKTGDQKSEQGLWAELFTILIIKDRYGINLAGQWHNDNFNKYDFAISEKIKLEVKSTTKELREHRFSHSQVYTENDVIISSVMMRKDDRGINILDLYNKVTELFEFKYELLTKIEKELQKYDKEHLTNYDYEYSEENIKFFLNKNIPHFEKPEPNGIHDTKYTIVLENIEELIEEELTVLIKKTE